MIYRETHIAPSLAKATFAKFVHSALTLTTAKSVDGLIVTNFVRNSHVPDSTSQKS